jgi:hypothetical protein
MPLHNPAQINFEIREKGVFEKRPQPIGDQQIDDRFVIQSWPEGFGKQFLAASDFRQGLLARDSLTIRVLGATLYYEEKYFWGEDQNIDRLKRLLDFLTDLADAVESQQ